MLSDNSEAFVSLAVYFFTMNSHKPKKMSQCRIKKPKPIENEKNPQK